MSDKKKVSRRTALAATAGASSLVVTSGFAAARSGSDKEELTDEEIARKLKQSLAESAHLVANPEQFEQFTEGKIEPRVDDETLREEILPHSTTPDDVEIYSGKYRNAKPPSGKHFAVETREEWQQRDAPVALEGTARSQISDFFYLEEHIGSGTLLGQTVSAGVGAGLLIEGGSGVTLDITLTADVFLEVETSVGTASGTVSLVSFGVSLGPDEDAGYCVGPVGADVGQLPGLEVELCGNIAVNDGLSSVELSASPEICADPCPAVSCGVCTSVGSVGFEVP
ncbi:hypothetical protein [Natronobacterium texcoconense]|uniref:Uncharacterized protein n=1 Tax=Natronobacterium texcoconense TaxID=1095778 RepID=A0A1H1B3L5_NATTX|nr:hypothetical protein [Natronobacterium texcoconense]SDQ46535.1 hypothetical protein SAMN04489842_0911 [Natronobacterium texcoconense]